VIVKRGFERNDPTVREILEHLSKRCRAGEVVALCVVVGSRGSTPQERGAKMLVLADGKTIGTLGGGCVEAEVRRVAMQLMLAKQSQLLEFRLDHDYGWDDGLICGGVMDVAVQIVDRSNVAPFDSLLQAVRAGQSAEFVLPYDERGEMKQYSEALGPPPMLVIAGGGHVGQALGALASGLEFRVTVIDDRPEYASAERFPNATSRIVGEIEDELRRIPIDDQTYIVIVTRGPRHDGSALLSVIDSPAKYVGLIGSKAKIKTIFDDLMSRGVDAARLARVHAPIGLEIGAVTVPEIATSIAAELVAVRRGRQGQVARPMKMSAEELERWIRGAGERAAQRAGSPSSAVPRAPDG
jgi:xanthine dehydrogenase accessory factor